MDFLFPARFHPEHVQEFLTKRKKKSDGWKCGVRPSSTLQKSRFLCNSATALTHTLIVLNQICLKTFTRRPHLQEHMILHTQDRPFKCSLCDEYFKSRFARLKHQEKFHLGDRILTYL